MTLCPPPLSPILFSACLGFAALLMGGCTEPTTTSPTGSVRNTTPVGVASQPTRYRVEFVTTWFKTNFPYEYPDTSILHRPHFSGWIGTGHDAGWHLFQAGGIPTPGLELLAEKGRPSPLDEEIGAAIAAGHATALATSEPLRDFSRTASFEILVDEAHPMASAVAMIAPSPDWFTGFEVDLREKNTWVARRTVDVMAWDAGTDDGITYLADNLDTLPKKPVTQASVMQFMKGGRVMRVGFVTLTRL